MNAKERPVTSNVKLHTVEALNKKQLCEGCKTWKGRSAFRNNNKKCTECNEHVYPEGYYNPGTRDKNRSRKW